VGGLMKIVNLRSKEYKGFLKEIVFKIKSSQYEALKSVNKELIKLYWDIGRMIIDRQNKYKWGDSIVESLTKDLQKEFHGMQGFSERNLWNMRKFYIEYKENAILQPLVAELGWTHNIIILNKCKSREEKEFYISMTKKYGWTKNVLIHQIENNSYRKYLSNQTNFNKAVPKKYRDQAKLAVKDEFTFDFLELSEDHNEHELEQGLMNNVRKFLVEMGGDVCFVGNQYRLDVGGEEFYIDVLLY
jgi:predicted nuclease of restriction endonuclease-like (RecB) superfamily